MEPIIIPPIPHLERSRSQKRHLLLAHLLSDPAYLTYYQHQANAGKYLILDNSAHEFGSGQPIRDVFALAEKVGARELVIPDTLFDWQKTLDQAVQAYDFLRTVALHREAPLEIRTMIVPQGDTPEGWSECLRGLLSIFGSAEGKITEKPPVIGISKDYHEMFEGGTMYLLEEYVLPLARQFRTEVHLLGWCRTLWDLSPIARRYGHLIRSVDSARPFTYAMFGIKLDPAKAAPMYPGRPDDFFHTELDRAQWEILEHNIRQFVLLSMGTI